MISTPTPFLLNIDEFIKDLRQRKDDDLFYEYPDENIKMIEEVLKLRRLVEEELKTLAQDGGTNSASDSWVIACYQTLEKLLEESKS